ncbi:hypothetical protein [Muricoccus radiodurans]|uniref:hypothetical protein n=1 Tax=Muricoccus radiodurans TaxID=2231721 RepID=UPI003CF7E705
MPETTAPPLNFAMSADRTRVTVTPRSITPFDLGPAEIDALVRALIIGRASMNPPRRSDDPEGLESVVTHHAMVTRLEPEGDGSGDFLLGVFHQGLGWVGTHLTRQEAQMMADVFNKGLAQAGEKGHVR